MSSCPTVPPLLVDAVGSRVAIDHSGLDPDARAAVESAWRDARSRDAVAPDATVVADPSISRARMLSDLSSAVTQAAIGAGRGKRWMLHAAGLAASDGRVIVLVGASGAGKTTATRTLARRWGYVSDETVGIDLDGTVHPYRKPLSIITDGHEVKVQRAPGDLDLRGLESTRLRVGRIVLLDRRADLRRARLVPVSPAEALTACAPHSSAITSLPRPLHAITRHLDATGGALRAEYTEAEQLLALCDDLDLAAAPIERPPLDDVPLQVAEAAGGPRYRLADAVDALSFDDGRLAVLTATSAGAGTLRVLAGLAPSLWKAADGATLDALEDAVMHGLGDETAGPAVRGILDQLVEAELLHVEA